MILIILVCILICTAIGYLCGSALVGLLVGIGIFVFIAWANGPTTYSTPRRRKRRK